MSAPAAVSFAKTSKISSTLARRLASTGAAGLDSAFCSSIIANYFLLELDILARRLRVAFERGLPNFLIFIDELRLITTRLEEHAEPAVFVRLHLLHHFSIGILDDKGVFGLEFPARAGDSPRDHVRFGRKRQAGGEHQQQASPRRKSK